jgi:gluconate 2-dehydrogenase gamma chain
MLRSARERFIVKRCAAQERRVGRSSMTDEVARRDFLLGVAGTAGALCAAAPDAAAETPAAPAKAPPAAEPPPETLQILTAAEAAFIGAAADTMIPADELSPSGSECGIVAYVDRQLAGAFGAGARMYRSGPFQPAAPGQGYQLPLTPLEFFRAGIDAANRWSKQSFGKSFDRLAAADRIAALTAIEQGKAEFAGIPARMFFTQLLQIVMEGFFADPIYGGNRDKASWRMIGYPGLPATYADKIERYRGKRYEAEPQSIADFS